jgi:hypothetical protein
MPAVKSVKVTESYVKVLISRMPEIAHRIFLKDPSNPTTYYNKRHGADKIAKILGLVNESFLDGEALKSQQCK